jgi:prepilin-type N-terminal cleavage/methylation domain-containing protein
MRRRSGVTLIEVLVAIFIMAIGMLALLALFPLGALSMAQALKDDRCASAAVNAEAFAVAHDIKHDVAVAGGNWGALNFNNAFGANTSPWTTTTAPWNVAPFTTANWNLGQAIGYSGPSFGVIVDPSMYPQDQLHSVGAVANPTVVTPGVPRCSLVLSKNYPNGRNHLPPNNPYLFPLDSAECARWCSMLDGITWVRGDNVGQNAVPDTSSTLGANIIRDNRYTWAWLLRRPNWALDNVIDMAVIIYNNRPTVQLTGEVTCGVPAPPQPQAIPGSTSVTIVYNPANPKPSLRSGGWILDATPVTVYTPPNPPGGLPVQVVYGYPYRVVNVTESGTDPVSGWPQLTLELQTPVRGPNNITAVTVLEYAVEVIDRGSFVMP